MSATLTAAQLGRTCLPQPDLLPRGGHFAAWEQPELFSGELWWRSGPCASRSEGTGVGHHLPQEALQAFTEAVVEVDGY